MKLQFEQALQMLEQQGKPSIFRILMQPMSPIIVHMPDVHVSEESPATLEPSPTATPPSTPDTPKPVIFVTHIPYELHTVVVLKKWWRTLSCRSCKTEIVGFKPTPKRPA